LNPSCMALLIGSALILPWIGAAGLAQTPAAPAPLPPRSTVPQAPVYKPPLLGAPATRVGGASRGDADRDVVLSVLAPESTGLTSRAQPTLYWYLAKRLAGPLEFTLNDDHSIKPLVEMPVNATQPGIQVLRLSYSLKPEVEYQWAIAAVTDPGQRASDLIASGTIRRVELPATVAVQINRASPSERLFLYAEQGFWYDALAALSEQIEAHPADSRWREYRAALLEQVGLHAIARQDRAFSVLSPEPDHANH